MRSCACQLGNIDVVVGCGDVTPLDVVSYSQIWHCAQFEGCIAHLELRRSRLI